MAYASPDWDSDQQVFLVCIYGVSPEQPYNIVQAPVTASAQDVVTQVNTHNIPCALLH